MDLVVMVNYSLVVEACVVLENSIRSATMHRLAMYEIGGLLSLFMKGLSKVLIQMDCQHGRLSIKIQ
jgi:hypothetical protein